MIIDLEWREFPNNKNQLELWMQDENEDWHKVSTRIMEICITCNGDKILEIQDNDRTLTCKCWNCKGLGYT